MRWSPSIRPSCWRRKARRENHSGPKDGASVSEALQLIAQTFRAAGIDDADVDARVLAGHALHLDRARLVSQSDRILEAREVNAISGLARAKTEARAVSRILWKKGILEFCACDNVRMSLGHDPRLNP